MVGVVVEVMVVVVVVAVVMMMVVVVVVSGPHTNHTNYRSCAGGDWLQRAQHVAVASYLSSAMWNDPVSTAITDARRAADRKLSPSGDPERRVGASTPPAALFDLTGLLIDAQLAREPAVSDIRVLPLSRNRECSNANGTMRVDAVAGRRALAPWRINARRMSDVASLNVVFRFTVGRT
jgi:hypothetical protein